VREDANGIGVSLPAAADWSPPAGYRKEVRVTARFTFDRFAESNLADPYPLYRRARDQEPVWYAEAFDVWVVSRYVDVRRILMDPMRFSSAFQVRTPQAPAPGVPEILAEGRPEVPALLNEDPPGHRRSRDLVARAFGPRRIAALEPRVETFADELIDGFADRRKADLVAELTSPLPLRAICALIGLPDEDRDKVGAWADQLVRLTSFGIEAEPQRDAARASVEFEDYLAAQIAARRDHGRDDMLTELITARSPGAAPLTDPELISLLIMLILAGHETTANLIGGALVRLLHRPELWNRTGGEPELVAAAVEETLRIDAPVQGMFRRTVFDVQVAGVTIPAGARVFALFAAANRDPAMFPEPDGFEPGRRSADQHLAFGRGIHFCVGAELARMEARVALRVLRRRLPSLRLEPGFRIPYLPNLMHRGPAALPVIWG
jgi:cytochrome P450